MPCIKSEIALSPKRQALNSIYAEIIAPVKKTVEVVQNVRFF
jgi:hypothetical protein